MSNDEDRKDAIVSARHISSILSYVVLGLGLWGLIGWKFVAPSLSSRTIKLVVMAPVACVLYLLTGVALWTLQERRAARFRTTGILSISAVVVMSGLLLVDYYVGIDLNLESTVLVFLNAPRSLPLLFDTVITAMSGLFLIGITILLLLKQRQVWHKVAHIVVAITGMAGLASLIGYLYDISPLYFAIQSRWVLALPSAVALVCASTATLLLRPDRGLVPIFVAGGLAGMAARRFLLFSVTATFVVGALLAYARRLINIPTEESILLFAVAVILLSFIMVYWNGKVIGRAEEGLRNREAELRAITSNSPDVIARFDRRLRHVFINPYGEKVYGKTRDEIIGRTSADLGMPPDKVAFWKRHFEEVFASGRQHSVEFEFDSPNLGRQNFLSVFVPEFDERGTVVSVLAISRDVTQIKEAQKRLSEAVREAKRRAEEAEEGRRILDALMDSIPEGIMVADAEGNIRSISRYLVAISGRAKGEIIGKSYLAINEQLIEPAAQHDRRKSGRPGNAESGAVTAIAETPPAESYPLTRALRKGEVTFSEERRVHLPDGSVHTAVLNAAPVRDTSGRIVGAVTSWRDITDRKKAEERLKATNRELEQFAYVASHDLQEPLRMVASFTELLERRYRDRFDERGRKYVKYIVDGASRMQHLIQDLLTFSRVGRLDTERHRVDLNIIADNAIADLAGTIKETRAEVNHDPLPTLNVNESSMSRLFLNLIGNALKFRKKDIPPKVHISARRRGDEWRLAISDNGIGIEPKYFDKIFVIFQRLHMREEYQGTGMGLAICKKIVENYGGRIWVESEPGKGTTFHFTIPNA